MTRQVLVYMGDGWHSDFQQTHFDCYSPPDFRVQVIVLIVIKTSNSKI